jgi:hypothetical protein
MTRAQARKLNPTQTRMLLWYADHPEAFYRPSGARNLQACRALARLRLLDERPGISVAGDVYYISDAGRVRAKLLQPPRD